MAQWAALAGLMAMAAGCGSMTGCGARVTVDGQCETGETGGAGGEGGDGGAGGEGGSGGATTSSSTSATMAACFASQCSNATSPIVGKVACDDGNQETADRCVDTPCGGFCAHMPVACDHLDPPEAQAVRCDDGNPCTTDWCANPTTCQHTPIDDCVP